MAAPPIASPWNAGWRLVMVLACLTCRGVGKAQVVNDNCAGGFAFGVQMLPALSSNCNQSGGAYGMVIMDSTDLAVPNFPYPAIPLSCTGFTASVAAPAKDRWYAFRVHCDLQFTATCSDTCHISFWSGGDCAMLAPMACYTLLPNTPMNGWVAGLGPMPSQDTLSMQISSNGVTQDVNYSVCLLNPDPPCTVIPVVPAPTPVVCFTYDTLVTANSSYSGPNGMINVEMQLGNGPFTIQWDTGDTSFVRDSLDAGNYSYWIADSEGCTESGSVTVAFDPDVTIAEAANSEHCGLAYDSRTNDLIFEPGWPGKSAVQLIDATGRLIWSSEISGEYARVHLPSLAPGVQIASIRTPQNEFCMIRFTVL